MLFNARLSDSCGIARSALSGNLINESRLSIWRRWALESWWALSGCFCAFDNAIYQAFDLTSIPNQRSKILLTVPKYCECIGSGGQMVGKSIYESLINSQGPFTPFDLSYSNAIWRHSLLHRSLKIRLGGRLLREFDGAEIGCEMRGVGNSIDL